jgi:transcription initiation factor TFIIB
VASSALYLSCLMNGEEKSQGEISLAAGVTTATIRTRYLWLKTSLKLKFV